MTLEGSSRSAPPFGSSLAFVKPLPKREEPLSRQKESSFEMAPFQPEAQSAVDLWCQLQPEESEGSHPQTSISSCQLGHFRVEEQIGRGGMGAVYRAVDSRLDRVVALKVLSPTQSNDQGSIERFRNEARAAARMDHDNIARVYFFGEDQGLSFIAFEFVHGCNIKQMIERLGALPPADAVNYTLQIAQALRHTDAAGVVHRDIKPSNIIITPAGRAKLVDLGLARKRDPQATSDLTVDGTTLGTFDYISPEQAKDPKNVDVRSDIYSLGCTLFHMLTGEPPYPKGTMLQKLLDHQAKGIPDASAKNPRIPPELSAVVRKMMASDPDERYATPERLIDDLKLMAHRCGLRPATSDEEIWVTPPSVDGWELWKHYGGWIVTAALLLIVVFAIDYIQRPSLDVPWQGAEDISDVSDDAPKVAASVESPVQPSSPPPSQRISQESDNTDRHVEDQSVTNTISPTVENPLEPSETVSSGSMKDLADVDSESKVDLLTERIDVPPFLGAQSEFLDSLPQPITPKSADALGNGTGNSDAVEPLKPLTSLPTRPDQSNGNAWNELDVRSGNGSQAATLEEAFLVVVNGVRRGSYSSLSEACSQAPPDASIELAFEGEATEIQSPLEVRRKRLIIRPAVEGTRPLLRFAAPPEWRLGRRSQSVNMIEVTRGSLEIYNIDIQFIVTADLDVQQWNLISLNSADELSLQGVSVTVENAEPRSAAIVELPEPAGIPFDISSPPPIQIDATDCFIRGEADLFLSQSIDPADINLTNVAVALGGTLLRMEGTDQRAIVSDMNALPTVNFELRQVTALMRSGFARFNVQTNFDVPKLKVDSDDSIIVVTSSESLIQMQGELDVLDFTDRLEWSDQATFLHGPAIPQGDPVWLISTPGERPRSFNREEFDDRWNRTRGPSRHVGGPLLNVLPGASFEKITQKDLELYDDPESRNPAINGAIDGTDAGVKWEATRLPRL